MKPYIMPGNLRMSRISIGLQESTSLAAETIRRIIASGLAGSNGKVSPTSGGPHEPNEKLFSLNSDQPRTLEEALSAAHVSNEWEVER